MPSKKRKYNARFPAGRIKKIMQTDEEVGKVAQAVPIIICRNTAVRHCCFTAEIDKLVVLPLSDPIEGHTTNKNKVTLELFVQSLLSRAMNVTMARNAKTLSPSHVKQCILAESRFDFLRDLVKNIPDVSAAEEKEMQMSAESSPNSSRFSDTSAQPRRVVREDSNSSSSSDVRPPKDILKSTLSGEVELKPRIETVTNIPPTSTVVSTDAAIDLSKKRDERPVRTANFYQETLVDPVQHKSVITVNPTYSHPQPSTSNYASLAPVEPLARIEAQIKKPDVKPFFYLDVRQDNDISMTPPRTPVTPILNIDFTKNLANPEIKVLDTTVASIVSTKDKLKEKFHRQNSRHKSERRVSKPATPVDIDHINSGTLQIDEDYDT